MIPTIVIGGYGSGISNAVAHKFGREGFAVALVARNAARVSAAATLLAETGITARGFAVDLGDDEAVRALIGEVRASLGPITVLHWNAYGGSAGDLLTASLAELRVGFDVSVHGLVAAVQAALPDLKTAKGSGLVTGGGVAFYDPKIDAKVVE
jgi:NADP-dependent 3-hydroxy acid dehydrogenase YdfG